MRPGPALLPGLAAVLTAAVVLFPFGQEARAVPAKGANCYIAECHTLGAAQAAPAGKGVQNILIDKLCGTVATPTSGIFQRNRDTNSWPAPHTLGPAQWNDELRCVGCHLNIQGNLNKNNYHSVHPIFSVTGTAPSANHIQCYDCHAAAQVTDNYHTTDPGSHLRWSQATLCDKCHVGTLSIDIGTVGPSFRIQRDPADRHLLARYNTTNWTSCYDPDDPDNFTNGGGCHAPHAHTVNNGLVGILNYDLTANNWTTYDVCSKCHSAQEPPAGVAADYYKKHDYDLSYVTRTECDICHNFVISTDRTYQTAGYHTQGNFVLKNRDGAAGTTMGPTDAFCIQCHDGGYPTVQAFTGWQNGAAGHGVGESANVDVDGDATNWGYDVNGHGKDSGNYPPASWKTSAATGNPAPVVAMATNFTTTRSCYSCHDPHATANVYMLETTINGSLATSDGTVNDSSVCAACHNPTAAIDGGGTPATSQFQAVTKALFDASAHSATGLLTCFGDSDGLHTRTGCHDPHGLGTGTTPYRSMMRTGNQEDGCTPATGCHGATPATGTFNKNSATGEMSLVSHHPVTANGTADYNGDAVNDEIECSNCHNPHLATMANPVIDPDAITTVQTDEPAAGGPQPNFDKFTDHCMGCHDGVAAPAGYGVSGAVIGRSHWGPGSAYPPSEGTAFQTECWHCHDSHGSQNIHMVGNTINTAPGSARGNDPLVSTNRSIRNALDGVWSTKLLSYSSSTQLDLTTAGSTPPDGTNNTLDDGVCDRCHNAVRGDNATHADAYGTNCMVAGCHVHNGLIQTYPDGMPMLGVSNCFGCHSSATGNRWKTADQYVTSALSGGKRGGTMTTGTDHDITMTTAATHDCNKCHVLTDATYPHKNGSVVTLQAAGMVSPIYSDVGDYKLMDASITLANAVQFCLRCHGDAVPNAAGGNFTGYDATNTPSVSADKTGTNYTSYGHGASVSLSGGRAGAPALECTTCHQYHGGTVTQVTPRTIVNTVNAGNMTERMYTGATYYPYTIGNSADKDGYCALTCHTASTTIDNVAYVAGTATIDHYWGEPGDAVKTQTGCPQTAAPWDDCETHPTDRAITVGPHYQLPPSASQLPLATFYDTPFATRGAIPGTGNVVCTTCHDPHAKVVSGNAGEADKQMLRESWSVTGSTLCGRCHI